MRGAVETSGSLFSSVDLEARIPTRHPLRKIRQEVSEALASPGRPSLPKLRRGCSLICARATMSMRCLWLAVRLRKARNPRELTFIT